MITRGTIPADWRLLDRRYGSDEAAVKQVTRWLVFRLVKLGVASEPDVDTRDDLVSVKDLYDHPAGVEAEWLRRNVQPLLSRQDALLMNHEGRVGANMEVVNFELGRVMERFHTTNVLEKTTDNREND